MCLLSGNVGLDDLDLTAVIGTALLAHSEAGAERRTSGKRRGPEFPASSEKNVSYHVSDGILSPWGLPC